MEDRKSSGISKIRPISNMKSQFATRSVVYGLVVGISRRGFCAADVFEAVVRAHGDGVFARRPEVAHA